MYVYVYVYVCSMHGVTHVHVCVHIPSTYVCSVLASYACIQFNSILYQHKTEVYTKKLVSRCNIFTKKFKNRNIYIQNRDQSIMYIE